MLKRTLSIDTQNKVGEKILLKGWVNTIRDHGQITFVDLRDRTGIVQCVLKEPVKLTPESVVEIEGEVKKRPENLVNKEIETGEVEVKVEKINIISKAEELPIPIDTEGLEIEEESRLKYRYLDLRRKRLNTNIQVRSDYIRAAREYLFNEDFLEIETPVLTKSTPEGSRDFIVPSRLAKGKFYALPQSPQQYKQLLMIAGFEKYFQIARCFRDEDLRADRAFEHTQIDIEMSFVNREDVMRLVEEMTVFALKKIGAKISKVPFPIFTYKEAMEKFNSDKFDLRSAKEKKKGIVSLAWVIDFPFFEKNKNGKWTFTHNPFSAPLDDINEKMLLNKERVGEIITSQYDLVCNGFEIGGGSIRAHKPEVLKTTYEIMGYTEEEIENSIGHMLKAFKYGVPPHGGCAQGFERLLMGFLDEDYIREIQAFPTTGKGKISVMDAPSKAAKEQLQELGIRLQEK